MKHMYQIDIDDYIEACKLAMKRGKKPGESIAEELCEVIKKSGKKLKELGVTEMTQDEMMKDNAMNGKKVLSMETKNGQTTFKVARPKEE